MYYKRRRKILSKRKPLVRRRYTRVRRFIKKRPIYKKTRYSLGFPKVAHTKLKLCSNLVTYTSAQTYIDWKIPLNNPYGPDVAGDLPNNYEALAGIYAKHFCSGGYYRCTIMNAAANDTCSLAYCINNDSVDYPSATTGFRTTAQNGRTRYISNVSNGSGNKLIIKGRWNINKYIKVKQRWNELLVPVNTAPANAATVWLHFSGKMSNTDTISLRVVYEFWFDVHWYQELADEADEEKAGDELTQQALEAITTPMDDIKGGSIQIIPPMQESKSNLIKGKLIKQSK